MKLFFLALLLVISCSTLVNGDCITIDASKCEYPCSLSYEICEEECTQINTCTGLIPLYVLVSDIADGSVSGTYYSDSSCSVKVSDISYQCNSCQVFEGFSFYMECPSSNTLVIVLSILGVIAVCGCIILLVVGGIFIYKRKNSNYQQFD